MKTLAEIRDELSDNYADQPRCAQLHRNDKEWHRIRQAHAVGFDVGAKAVMEQAQKLVEALFYAHSTYHSAHAAFLGSCGICSALKGWQEFVGHTTNKP